MMLAKFTGLKSPTFDDYIDDLAVMFEAYQSEDEQELHQVRNAMTIIDDLVATADRLPKLPRRKGDE